VSNFIVNYHAGVNYVPYTAPSGPPTSGLWADWDATAGITHSSNRVSVWADQSGNGRDLSQPTAGNQPLWNGTDAINFQGSRIDALNIATTIAQRFTVYIIAQVNVTTNGDAAQMMIDANGNLFMLVTRTAGVNNMQAYGNSFGSLLTSTASVTNSTYYMFKGDYNGGSSAITTNATVTSGSLGSNTTGSPLFVGYFGSNTTSFDVKRILMYQGTHNATDVATYLTSTYGVP
jgi:hypothetical protein